MDCLKGAPTEADAMKWVGKHRWHVPLSKDRAGPNCAHYLSHFLGMECAERC
jgi:hypothetical protein